MAFKTEFTGTEGQSSYYNSLLSGAQFQVFREGQYQYRIGSNRIMDTTTGTIFFIPALYAGERIKIII